jgi:hypothetical protein
LQAKASLNNNNSNLEINLGTTQTQISKKEYSKRGSSQGDRERDRGRGDSGNKPDVDCYNYDKYRLLCSDCWVKKKVEGKTNYTKENVDDVLMMTHNETNSESGTVWSLNTHTRVITCRDTRTYLLRWRRLLEQSHLVMLQR